jgi:Uncharacterised conserved protein (DUF2228)
MSPLDARREQLRRLYGFDFPEDLFRFWEFARRLKPLDPINALSEGLGITLVGPFDVLAGRFDGPPPRYSALLHWRYFLDPPEFFTVFAGDTDGSHWGYYLDDPGADGGDTVAHYWARDAFELTADSPGLFGSARMYLEDLHDAAEDPSRVAELARLRERLTAYATGDRPQIGLEYTDRYARKRYRTRTPIASTPEGMGIVVSPEAYRPLSLTGKALWRRLRKERNPIDLVEEARQALRDGFPGAALELGKCLWAFVEEPRMSYAYELLDAAYQALERPALREVLRVHRANRELESVDIFEQERGEREGE